MYILSCILASYYICIITFIYYNLFHVLIHQADELSDFDVNFKNFWSQLKIPLEG